MTLRPFEDIIKEIEFEGETFVPIEEIAKISFSHVDSKKIKLVESDFSPNHIICYFKIAASTANFIVSINSIFDIYITYLIDTEKIETHRQVKIVKSLIKWGFIEP